MLAGIWGRNHNELIDFDEVWRFRHRHFVERFGWEAIRRSDGREIDQFDTDTAIHLVLKNQADELVGYTRLLPTLGPHLLRDVYPELLDGAELPTGEKIFEFTRCVAEPEESMLGVSASNILITAAVEYCVTVGIETLVVETHPKLVELMLYNGWDVRPLAAPRNVGNDLVVPVVADISAKSLLTHHSNYGVNGSLIDFDRSNKSPLGPSQPLKMLPYLDGWHRGPENLIETRA